MRVLNLAHDIIDSELVERVKRFVYNNQYSLPVCMFPNLTTKIQKSAHFSVFSLKLSSLLSIKDATLSISFILLSLNKGVIYLLYE